MLGLMQEWPLLCHKIIDYAAAQHGKREVVSRSVEGPITRTNYAEIRVRALKVAQALEREGFQLGDRIATLGWNTARHMEAWYGIMGIGAIYHTLNPRLFPEQIAWIMNHAEDQAIFTDLTFLPIVEAIAGSVKSLRKVIVLTDAAHMPKDSKLDLVCYEDWIGEVDGDFAWKEFDENTASGMCYTSGTTGDPKGVVYSHRSNVLHAMIASFPDALNLSSNEAIMPVVPMFHANAWGIAMAAPMVGGIFTSFMLELFVYPAIYAVWKKWKLDNNKLNEKIAEFLEEKKKDSIVHLKKITDYLLFQCNKRICVLFDNADQLNDADQKEVFLPEEDEKKHEKVIVHQLLS